MSSSNTRRTFLIPASEILPEIHVHDREIRSIDFHQHSILIQVSWKFRFSDLSTAVFDILNRFGNFNARIEFKQLSKKNPEQRWIWISLYIILMT